MKDLIKQFEKLSVFKKISFLVVLFLLIFLPVAVFVSLQTKNINSKAAEVPTLTPTPVVKIGATGIQGGGRPKTTISPRPSITRPSGPIPTSEDTKEVGVGYYKPTSTPTPTPTVTPTPVSSVWIP